MERSAAMTALRAGVSYIATGIAAVRTLGRRILLLAGLCVVCMGAGIAPVFADSPSSGGDVTVAQSLGDRELTVMLRRASR